MLASELRKPCIFRNGTGRPRHARQDHTDPPCATDLRPGLRENDHVFVEGSGVEQDTLYLTVFGDTVRMMLTDSAGTANTIEEGKVSCTEERGSHP
jgi:hypothetical protein